MKWVEPVCNFDLEAGLIDDCVVKHRRVLPAVDIIVEVRNRNSCRILVISTSRSGSTRIESLAAITPHLRPVQEA